MFDDINANAPGKVPGNLPVSEPEDMFAATEVSDVNQTSAVGAGKLQPKIEQSSAKASPSLVDLSTPKIETIPEELSRLNKVKNPSFAKNVMILAIVLIGLGILAGGSWFVYSMYVKAPVETPDFSLPVNNVNVGETEEQVLPEQVENVLPSGVESAQNDDAVLFGEPVDTDSDNLTDSRERELGTNPNDFDTDNDGISDGDEVLTWKTNPLLADTDGDGFQDGAEIANGYNPLGPGKIFEAPQQ